MTNDCGYSRPSTLLGLMSTRTMALLGTTPGIQPWVLFSFSVAPRTISTSEPGTLGWVLPITTWFAHRLPPTPNTPIDHLSSSGITPLARAVVTTGIEYSAAKARIAAPASDHTAPLPASSVMRVDDASSGGTFRAACGSRMRGDSTAPTGT